MYKKIVFYLLCAFLAKYSVVAFSAEKFFYNANDFSSKRYNVQTGNIFSIVLIPRFNEKAYEEYFRSVQIHSNQSNVNVPLADAPDRIEICDISNPLEYEISFNNYLIKLNDKENQSWIFLVENSYNKLKAETVRDTVFSKIRKPQKEGNAIILKDGIRLYVDRHLSHASRIHIDTQINELKVRFVLYKDGSFYPDEATIDYTQIGDSSFDIREKLLEKYPQHFGDNRYTDLHLYNWNLVYVDFIGVKAEDFQKIGYLEIESSDLANDYKSQLKHKDDCDEVLVSNIIGRNYYDAINFRIINKMRDNLDIKISRKVYKLKPAFNEELRNLINASPDIVSDHRLLNDQLQFPYQSKFYFDKSESFNMVRFFDESNPLYKHFVPMLVVDFERNQVNSHKVIYAFSSLIFILTVFLIFYDKILHLLNNSVLFIKKTKYLNLLFWVFLVFSILYGFKFVRNYHFYIATIGLLFAFLYSKKKKSTFLLYLLLSISLSVTLYSIYQENSSPIYLSLMNVILVYNAIVSFSKTIQDKYAISCNNVLKFIIILGVLLGFLIPTLDVIASVSLISLFILITKRTL